MRLELQTRVNGEVVQHAHADQIWYGGDGDVAEITVGGERPLDPVVAT